jgi:hypothetical protein
MNGMHKLLVCTGDINLLSENKNTLKRTVLLVTSIQIYLEVNMLMSHHQVADKITIQKQIKKHRKCGTIKILVNDKMNQNSINIEIKTGLT